MLFSPAPISVSTSVETCLALLLSMRPVSVTTHTGPLRACAIFSPSLIPHPPKASKGKPLKEALGHSHAVVRLLPLVVEAVDELLGDVNAEPARARPAAGRGGHWRRRLARIVRLPVIDDLGLDRAAIDGQPDP